MVLRPLILRDTQNPELEITPLARLPALIGKIAPLDGRSVETLAHIARIIRERGLMATTKRGVGAAEMTSRDAANLLIALNGAQHPQEAPEAVQYYRTLPLTRQSDPGKGYPASAYKVLNAPNFGEALEKLIDIVPVLVKSARTKHNRLHERATLDEFLSALKKVRCVNVRFEKASAWIALYDKDMFDNYWVDAQSSFACKNKQVLAPFRQRWNDRQVVVEIGLLTLMAVWFALRPSETLATISEASPAWANATSR